MCCDSDNLQFSSLNIGYYQMLSSSVVFVISLVLYLAEAHSNKSRTEDRTRNFIVVISSCAAVFVLALVLVNGANERHVKKCLTWILGQIVLLVVGGLLFFPTKAMQGMFIVALSVYITDIYFIFVVASHVAHLRRQSSYDNENDQVYDL